MDENKMLNILEQIISSTRERIKIDRSKVSLQKARKRAESKTKNLVKKRFYNALKKERIQIIAEVKKASPSRGVICEDFNHLEIARQYAAGGAAALSVLTEEKYFQGSLEYLEDISHKVALPLLRKDFIIDDYQIYQAAASGASAILLIAAALTEEQIKDFSAIAHSLKMDALVEIHKQCELEKVLRADAGIIGVNNRNLRTLRVSLQTSMDLIKAIPDHLLKVSESGIHNREDVISLEKAGFNAILIGETLMRQKDRAAFIKNLGGV
ncbi:MAG: indole-3-glycerol phosphate synthase TrpC [Calditrichaeota bacterium]|nr:indole-3-glycerol phosphate synthase TrpC [Calditrichota bacterium]